MILRNCLFCKKPFRKGEEKCRFCSSFCSNNFNKNGLKKIILPPHGVKLAEFVGICLGDGCVSNYQVSVTLNKKADKNYIPYVQALMKSLFSNTKISLINKIKDNAVDVRLYSKQIVNFLQEMGIISNKKIIPQWIFSQEVYKRACVRGLFDTEGSISFKQYKGIKKISVYKQLNFRNTQIEFIKFVRDVLLDINLKPTLTLKKSLYISNDRDIGIFKKYIGFSNPKLQQRSLVNTPEKYVKLPGN